MRRLRLAIGGGLGYAPEVVRARGIVAGLALAVAVAHAASTPLEQSVVPVTPGIEQRVEPIESATAQEVEPLEGDGLQHVLTPAPKGAFRRGAESVGKGALAVMALGISIGFTAASLLFF